MSIEQLVEKLRGLPAEKQREVLELIESLVESVRADTPLRSLEGLWAGRGIDLTREDIDEARREAFLEVPTETEVSNADLDRRRELVARIRAAPKLLRAPEGMTSVELIREDRDSH